MYTQSVRMCYETWTWNSQTLKTIKLLEMREIINTPNGHNNIRMMKVMKKYIMWGKFNYPTNAKLENLIHKKWLVEISGIRRTSWRKSPSCGTIPKPKTESYVESPTTIYVVLHIGRGKIKSLEQVMWCVMQELSIQVDAKYKACGKEHEIYLYMRK